MIQYRMNRLFNAKSGKCLDVAIDHGFFNERAFLSGIEDLEFAVRTLVAAAPDAIQLTIGRARLQQSIPGAPNGTAWAEKVINSQPQSGGITEVIAHHSFGQTNRPTFLCQKNCAYSKS
jgi:hypothetical protein